MSQRDRPAVTAVLGPTNTGKTHLAVERFMAHSSGIMGFPLRLLAREVYDRVVAAKGAREVGLVTGEEKIVPPGARWLLCTAESMPLDRDVAFVALDEAQLGADPERGHVFTDRLLRARGREETMILGSESLRPMVKALVPETEIIGRPRFSTLSYAGARKLSRLPKRSAIVAFSSDEVYAVAEMIRRTRGGAAVVMGALSPATRNAQVAMFMNGDVDYLVATDAIGMGLNLDVAHVAFAGLAKFDGRRKRRLTIAEMAQIAGRAGRHQRDGTFGSLGAEDGPAAFAPHEIEAIEAHRFPRLERLYWRDGTPDTGSLDGLVAALEARPGRPELKAAPEAIDLAVLKALAADPDIRTRAADQAVVARLWAACGLPDFRKVGAEPHARLVGRIFRHLSEGDGHVPAPWFASELERLDRVEGDVDAIAARIASVRVWAYVAHRADWLAEPTHWADRTRAIEARLSDALHLRLTERFVDRRTTMLMRTIGNDPALLDVRVAAGGQIEVEGEPIGALEGFRFVPDPAARGADAKRLVAAAERHLPRELARRAERLADSPDSAFSLTADYGGAVAIRWEGADIARLAGGRTLLAPRIVNDRGVAMLPPAPRGAIERRLARWLASEVRRRLAPLARIGEAAVDPATPAPLRGVLAQLAEAGGVVPRLAVDAALSALDREARKRLQRLGVVVGALDLFHPLLLKPEAMRWRLALDAVARGKPMPPVPMPGLGLIDRPAPALAAAARAAGFHAFGDQMLRVDLAERIARAVHDTREGRAPFMPDYALATSLGVGAETFTRLMRALGFRAVEGETGAWRWHGRRRRAAETPRDNAAFAALAEWRKG